MTPDFLLWGLVGYVAYYLSHLIRPTRAKGGWDFVMEVGLLSLLCFVIARLVSVLLLESSRVALPSWISLTIGFAVGGAVGLLLGFTYRQRARLASAYYRRATGSRRNFLHSDVFFETCEELLGDTVMFSMKSGKVYVGLLTAATSDPNETKRYIRFVPLLSGFRSKEDQKITYNTFYDPQQDERRAFLIAADEISSLAPFSFEQLEKFAQSDTVSFDIPASFLD